jgi:hypothetical protein
MSQQREQFARQLEEAADKIRDVPKHELQILLRRAAIRLRNVPVVPEEEWAPIEDDDDDDPGAA